MKLSSVENGISRLSGLSPRTILPPMNFSEVSSIILSSLLKRYSFGEMKTRKIVLKTNVGLFDFWHRKRACCYRSRSEKTSSSQIAHNRMFLPRPIRDNQANDFRSSAARIPKRERGALVA
jgi:hypothetical protein